MNPEDENKEARQLAPTLFGLPKEDPFVVEEDFFERFPHQVQALAGTPQRRHYGIWLKRAAIALPVLAVIAFGIHQLSNNPQPNRKPVASTAISPEAADQYIAATDLDTPELLAEVPAAEWPVYDTVTVHLTTAEALAYVDRENIDLTDLILTQ